MHQYQSLSPDRCNVPARYFLELYSGLINLRRMLTGPLKCHLYQSSAQSEATVFWHDSHARQLDTRLVCPVILREVLYSRIVWVCEPLMWWLWGWHESDDADWGGCAGCVGRGVNDPLPAASVIVINLGCSGAVLFVDEDAHAHFHGIVEDWRVVNVV